MTSEVLSVGVGEREVSFCLLCPLIENDDYFLRVCMHVCTQIQKNMHVITFDYNNQYQKISRVFSSIGT